ncbi:hypothetical protein PG994_010563 [Apiospora phragmitis]|uniref:tRNA (guanine(37)-N1)-methyltransferase n=1 Tax=Apiospora phragmitis TaxID=2905665 RepID=A0ABR1TQH1_9PEZI
MAVQATRSKEEMNGFRPSVARAVAGVLDRSLFAKTVPLAAAIISENKLISRYRRDLEKSKEILSADRISAIAPHPDKSLASQGKKCLLLNPAVKPTAPETWGTVLKEGVDKSELEVIPYNLNLDYEYFSALDVLSVVLPPELHDEIPSGFNIAGHVAHLNLREAYLPYKNLIGEIIVDKNPHIRTVINKVDNVGSESEFRTFAYEVLAGPDDLDVEVVCDVMAGIGPFAVPAGKRGVFVWANDMNPESYRYLQEAIQRNKVGTYVRPFNEDGRTFIHNAADSVYAASQAGDHALIQTKVRRHLRGAAGTADETPPPQKIPVPPTISHFVMNLPAMAYTFVHHFRGLYAGHEGLFAPNTETKLPLVHVHCFALKSDDEVPLLDICERLTSKLGVKMVPGDAEKPGEVSIHNVRDVAPAKRMWCASFRLPREVAFAARG